MFATRSRLRFARSLGLSVLLTALAGCGAQGTGDSSLHKGSGDLDLARLAEMKQAMRTKLMHRAAANPLQDMNPEADYQRDDDPALLVDMGSALERNLSALDAAGLTRGAISGEPWSDYYWATSGGLLGNRYADPAFPGSGNWKASNAYITKNTVESVLASRNGSRINALSPSEKYDLLIRDPQKTLTASLWNEGRALLERNGQIAGWEGLCDGWAAASLMLPRPSKAVSFKAATGQEITLYPSDIKALASLLWARSTAPIRFMGGRCNDVSPNRDQTGRIKSQQCLDNNPGAWHLAVVNQIGVARRGLIMDAASDYQVWNQPILSYSYTYFHPRTGRTVSSLDEALAPLASFPEDRFKAYRSPVASHVVGVEMEVIYLNETSPSTRMSDGPEFDAKVRIQYRYDLELDSTGKVIGGEWHQDRHPDFLWVPVPDATVTSTGESYLQGDWQISTQVPQSWVIPLRVSSQKSQPAAIIVNALVEQASRAE